MSIHHLFDKAKTVAGLEWRLSRIGNRPRNLFVVYVIHCKDPQPEILDHLWASADTQVPSLCWLVERTGEWALRRGHRIPLCQECRDHHRLCDRVKGLPVEDLLPRKDPRKNW